MSIVIRTAKTSNGSGRGQVVAKSQGKQRTVSWDHAKSPEQNHAAACGALLNVLCDDRQRAMLRHPSGGQRVRQAYSETAQDTFSTVWTVNV